MKEQIEAKEERMLSVLKMVTKIQKLSTHHFFRDMQ